MVFGLLILEVMRILTFFLLLALGSPQARACVNVPTNLVVNGTAFATHPVVVNGNSITFQAGQGTLELSYQGISRKWCFERRSLSGAGEDSGCITETRAGGGEAMLMVKNQLKRSLPLRDASGEIYAELFINKGMLSARLLNENGDIGDQSLNFQDQSEAAHQSVKVTSRLCGAGLKCEGASFTSTRNALMRSPDSRAQARAYGPLDLANTKADYHARACRPPYAVQRRGPIYYKIADRVDVSG
jgi:hypothetical protein